MKLSELSPKFIKRLTNKSKRYAERSEADGIIFLCPVCFKKNGSAVGTHSIICWEPSVPQDTSPTPGRWKMIGEGFHDLTLVAEKSSIKLNGGCKAHFHIQNGKIV
jgi:hypothetical protein